MLRIWGIALLVLLSTGSMVQAKGRVLIFAAASMKNVLETIGAKFETNCDCKTVFSFAGSGTLARQIDAGAPADVYISADVKWLDWLNERDGLEIKGQGIIARNRLVVTISVDRPEGIVSDKAELLALLGKGRIAMGNPVSVPAGRYGKQALISTDLWDDVSSQLVFGENVRISLGLAARGDVDAAIVYQSDVSAEPRVKVVYRFAADTHEKILYPAAVVRSNVLANKFLAFLKSADAHQIFLQFGFAGEANASASDASISDASASDG